ncbi:MAG TPA: ABC-F family ATP-binding cassette domain-containing protein, partial [Candidatus Limnocylindria bacterium]|nr:ABC-F family ATP-binding cassette domain-containing protein [Candidatus Limnocylindria bacterium]
RRWSAPPAQLSGGEQTRAALARLLIADDELLLLDEPTNHLDVAAIEWLETVLGRRTGALVVASHDRAFLDATVERVWELRERRLTAFRGNYARYVAQRQQRDERSAREAEAHTRRIERERELVQRYRSQRKHTKMHEHERRLEALEQAPPEGPRREQRLALDPSAAGRRSRAVHRTAQVALSVDGLACGYGGRPIVRTDRLEAAGGERVGIVGPNGAGKTTLLRTLAGEIAPLGGRIELGHAVTPAYLAQVRRTPPRGTTVLETLALATGLDAGPARSHLARFLFRGDEVAKPVAELSGGERSRLDLAILGAAGANLLLLDEPTNHLDIPARESLEAFLREVAATVLLVSHDRRLLETVCNRLWVVAADDGQPGRVAPFDGSYRDWRAAVGAGWTLDVELARRAGARPTTAAVSPGRADHPPRRRPASGGGGRPAGRRPALSKDAYRRRRELVEADLTRLGLRKSQLELALADPQVQANYVELRRISSELADVDSALAQVEDAWLVLAEQAPR